jgi:prepilin-type N-terminal cleavage/methylation domain-containing protein
MAIAHFDIRQPAKSRDAPSEERPGMTLAETLVVVAIVAVLIGLTLPAVQMIREAVNRTRCRNNLEQIGLAIHQLDQVKGELPPAWETLPRRPDPFRRQEFAQGSVFFHLLPFVEQGPLYRESYRKDEFFPGGGYDESLVREKTVTTFICPSDPTNTKPGLGSYGVNEHIFVRLPLPGDDPGNTALAKCVPDGLSNTVLCAELLGQCGSQFGGITDIYWSHQWAYYRADAMFVRRTSPADCVLQQAATPHTVMHVCLGDGSIRPVSLSISPPTWYFASNPRDGNALGPDWEP